MALESINTGATDSQVGDPRSGVGQDLKILAGSALLTDTISETTSGSGVTIDGLLIKDSGFVAAGTTDLNGLKLVLDADADTSITADTDDQIDIEVSGADDFRITANTFTSLSGSTIATNTIAETTAGSGVTIDGLLVKDGGIGAVASNSPRLVHTGGNPAQVSTDGTDATPAATEVYIGEVFVPATMTLTGVSVMNGSVASGNLKVGLASSAGAVVATSGSTAMSGTDAYQRVPFTATYTAVGPATYYVLLFFDNNTARYNTHTFGDFGAAKQTGQTYATGFTTITPPSTFTTALAPIASLY